MNCSFLSKKLRQLYPCITAIGLIQSENTLYIQVIEIDEKQRNKGFGSKILQTIISCCVSHQMSSIHLKPIKNGKNKVSEKLIRFYEKNGFEKYYKEDEMYFEYKLKK